MNELFWGFVVGLILGVGIVGFSKPYGTIFVGIVATVLGIAFLCKGERK